ncbi:MAG: class I SAM-dependent methyltransferase [Spirochaetales bacterium]|nr:class I SAM-dependent methyltransferase [Spirochaetales bacterium]
MSQEICPLCSEPAGPFYEITRKTGGFRSFSHCPSCSFVFQDRLPEEEEERERYELHRNNPEDKGYINWLESFVKSAVLPWYESGQILDYGSGPRPVLTELLSARGYSVSSYDPYFAPSWPEEGPFSLILLCEVLEHINDPVSDFRRLYDAADEGAVLSVMTQFLPSNSRDDFKGWWYKEDPTHIRFFTPLSLKILGEKSGWELISENKKSLAVFRKE